MIIVVVGVGPGMLTEEGVKAIRKASVVYGAKRALELAQEYITCEAKTITDYKSLTPLACRCSRLIHWRPYVFRAREICRGKRYCYSRNLLDASSLLASESEPD